MEKNISNENYQHFYKTLFHLSLHCKALYNSELRFVNSVQDCILCCNQVWFQNARAKYRRNLMKQDSNGNVKDGQGVNSPGNLSDNTQTSFTEFNDEGSRSPEPMTDMGSPKSILDLQDQVGILDSERSGRMGHSMALGQSNSFNELLAMN